MGLEIGTYILENSCSLPPGTATTVPCWVQHAVPFGSPARVIGGLTIHDHELTLGNIDLNRPIIKFTVLLDDKKFHLRRLRIMILGQGSLFQKATKNLTVAANQRVSSYVISEI
jgi:hypothetical protein